MADKEKPTEEVAAQEVAAQEVATEEVAAQEVAAQEVAAQEVAAQEVAAPARERTFRVRHGAVSGVKANKKGEMQEHDFPHGAIVTESDLAGHAAFYFQQGAIVPLEAE